MAKPLLPEAEATEKLRPIFEKVFPVAGGSGSDSPDFAAWFRGGIISRDEFEFLTANGVECDPDRRSLRIDVQPPDAQSHATLTVCRRSPQPKRRTAPLNEIAGIIDQARPAAASVRVGPDGPKNPALLVLAPYFGIHLSEFADIALSANRLIVGLGPEHREALPAVRTLLRTEGVKVVFDEQVPAVQMVGGRTAMPAGTGICCEIPPASAGSIGALVQRLLHACGLNDDQEVSYSSPILDEREPGFVATAGHLHVWTAISRASCSTIDDISLEALGVDIDPAQFDFIRATIIKAAPAPGNQVSAAQVLAAAALVAREEFGPDAAARLRALGLDSSPAFGRALNRLIDAGILSASADDDQEDFETKSAFDAIFED